MFSSEPFLEVIIQTNALQWCHLFLTNVIISGMRGAHIVVSVQAISTHTEFKAIFSHTMEAIFTKMEGVRASCWTTSSLFGTFHCRQKLYTRLDLSGLELTRTGRWTPWRKSFRRSLKFYSTQRHKCGNFNQTK